MWVWATRWYPLQPQRKMLRLDSRLNNVVRVFVRATDFRSLLVEEMFPISSDLVPKEEKLMRCCPLMLTTFQRGCGI